MALNRLSDISKIRKIYYLALIPSFLKTISKFNNFFTVYDRRAFRTMLNISDGAFCENREFSESVNYVHKKLYLRCVTGF